MKLLNLIAITVLFIACNNQKQNASATVNEIKEEAIPNFFPVTNFIKGDIANIKNIGYTPFRKTTINGKTDSAWLKVDSLNVMFQEFLTPVIDTANVKKYFAEKSFLDQTLAAYTFTYDKKKDMKFDFAFSNWDVLVDQESQKVKRIYLVKKINNNTTKQLTWMAEKSCKIVTITNNKVVQEDKCSWSFEE